MERKSAAGSIRNKERSKKKFLDAVGEILKTKGYAALKINDIAATAGVDKKMIYTYFGGMDGLMDEYIRSQDYWSNVSSEGAMPSLDDGGKLLTIGTLLTQFDYVFNNKELQKLLLWRVSEHRKSLTKLTEMQEANGEVLFKAVSDPFFGEHAKEFRAIMAIMISGLYYLSSYSSSPNGTVFCGIDTNTAEGRDIIKKVVPFIIEQTFENLKLQKKE
ncbi:TetR/AcrR family transcriptional regulator [Chryseobacterium sp. NRRL B-14859]|uniref:TetR/AcrR family transcriptional regulator n=1 Tax=unclassified Chryseobacterium TaxID=2593645 RepID=UPI000F44D55A|nr:TetR family transcriptional regulator [Chryseobacterium sp. G0240]ROI06906.1 TetR/AcrR family transcriptional regulator [Chryseobacterium sp. G0240]